MKGKNFTRMHSSRMRTVLSSGRLLRGSSPLGGGAYSGGCLLGVSAPQGVCSQGCLLPGVSAGGACLLRGVPAPGGMLWGGVCSWRVFALGGSAQGVCSGGVWGCVCSRGCGIPACTEADTPPPCGQTHACKNITFATSLWTVIIHRSRLLLCNR